MIDNPVLLWLDRLTSRQEPKTAAHLSGRLITTTRSVSLYIRINSDSQSNIIITVKGQHKAYTQGAKSRVCRSKLNNFSCVVLCSSLLHSYCLHTMWNGHLIQTSSVIVHRNFFWAISFQNFDQKLSYKELSVIWYLSKTQHIFHQVHHKGKKKKNNNKKKIFSFNFMPLT